VTVRKKHISGLRGRRSLDRHRSKLLDDLTHALLEITCPVCDKDYVARPRQRVCPPCWRSLGFPSSRALYSILRRRREGLAMRTKSAPGVVRVRPDDELRAEVEAERCREIGTDWILRRRQMEKREEEADRG